MSCHKKNKENSFIFIPIVKTPFVRPTQDSVIPRKMRLLHHGTAAMQTAAKIKEEATHRSSQKGMASLSIPPSTAPIYKEIYLRLKTWFHLLRQTLPFNFCDMFFIILDTTGRAWLVRTISNTWNCVIQFISSECYELHLELQLELSHQFRSLHEWNYGLGNYFNLNFQLRDKKYNSNICYDASSWYSWSSQPQHTLLN